MAEVSEADPGRQWMLELRGGDETACRRIVQHYGARVVRFFARFGADPATAEDLAQETFLRIYRARERYEPTARFSTWMYRIMTRISLNESTRNRWRRARPLGDAGDGEGTPRGLPEPEAETADQPLTALRRAEVRAQVRRAVDDLPDNQRAALLLHRFEGLSYEEVGAALGLRLPAVKSLLFRARENVRKRLTADVGEEVHDELR